MTCYPCLWTCLITGKKPLVFLLLLYGSFAALTVAVQALLLLWLWLHRLFCCSDCGWPMCGPQCARQPVHRWQVGYMTTVWLSIIERACSFQSFFETPSIQNCWIWAETGNEKKNSYTFCEHSKSELVLRSKFCLTPIWIFLTPYNWELRIWKGKLRGLGNIWNSRNSRNNCTNLLFSPPIF